MPIPSHKSQVSTGLTASLPACAAAALQSGKGTIRVTVRDAARQPVPNAEVTLLVVDKAILDLMPYDLQVNDSRMLLCIGDIVPRVQWWLLEGASRHGPLCPVTGLFACRTRCPRQFCGC